MKVGGRGLIRETDDVSVAQLRHEAVQINVNVSRNAPASTKRVLHDANAVFGLTGPELALNEVDRHGQPLAPL